MYMINNLIDDVVTKKLKTVLAMGEHGGTKYSDIVVKDGNIMIKNLYARPEEITKKLAAKHLPVVARLVHCKNAGHATWSTAQGDWASVGNAGMETKGFICSASA